MSGKSLWVFQPDTLGYRFNDEHPFNQKRIQLTTDLLMEVGALSKDQFRSGPSASESDLCHVHQTKFVEAVKQLSKPESAGLTAPQRGLGDSDTPIFEKMHDISSAVVGGSLLAAELVMNGESDHALHLAGGLHHAMPDRAAGFCIYNDASVMIAHLKHKYQARVLYVDTDVHHGDGVQMSFYNDPDVFTFSIHETGKYLYPGTGDVSERGIDAGFGTTLNMPVQPYTEDESWIDCFDDLLEKTVKHFRPDIIVSQHGCDAHAYDPLSHVHCSMDIYKHMPRTIHQLAHTYCEGRWIALGGGGYDIWRVVPRAWSLLWMEMTDNELIKKLDENPLIPLPEQWVSRWQPHSKEKLPTTWLDDKNTDSWLEMPRRQHIQLQNAEMKKVASLYLNP